MAHKTIMISDEAYEILKRRKKGNESFTEVIIRMDSERGGIKRLLDFAKSGDFSPISSETAKIMKEASRESRKSLKTRDFRL